MKKNSKLSGLYLGILFFLMYLPIGVVVVFSFNEARLPVRFTGFSMKWYQELFQDRDMLQALKNSLILAVSSCAVSAVIGTLGAVGLSRIHWKTKGMLEYISILPLMIPEIILGMVLMAFFYTRTCNKNADHHIIHGHGKGQQRAGYDSRHDQRQGNVPKCPERTCTKISGCLLKRWVHSHKPCFYFH